MWFLALFSQTLKSNSVRLSTLLLLTLVNLTMVVAILGKLLLLENCENRDYLIDEGLEKDTSLWNIHSRAVWAVRGAPPPQPVFLCGLLSVGEAGRVTESQESASNDVYAT